MPAHLQTVHPRTHAGMVEAKDVQGVLVPVETTPRSTLTQRQAELRGRLVQTVRDALPLVYRAERASESADRAYHAVAHVLVELRHQFVTSDGRTPDLRGRSRGYRAIVRYAYAAA